MDEFWASAVPNWITALATVAALVLATIGALAAWRSLQTQQRRDEADRRQLIATRAKTVTGQWVRLWRAARNEGDAEQLEFGLLLTNHGTTPAFDVTVEGIARGATCALPVVEALQPGEVFLRKDLKGSSTHFTMIRMGADVERVEAIFKPDWLVHGVAFIHDGERVHWRSRELPSAAEEP